MLFTLRHSIAQKLPRNAQAIALNIRLLLLKRQSSIQDQIDPLHCSV
jgi:hypothetical protein